MNRQNQIVPLREEKGVLLYQNALIVEGELNFDQWEKLFHKIKSWHGAAMWWIGDLVNYGEGKFKERYAQVIDPTDYALETVRKAAWVCQRIPFVNRITNLPFSFHALVASLEEKKRDKILAKVADEHLTQAELRKLISKKAPPLPVPVQMQEAIHKFVQTMTALLELMPLKDWHPDALSTIKTLFDSAMGEVRTAFKWE